MNPNNYLKWLAVVAPVIISFCLADFAGNLWQTYLLGGLAGGVSYLIFTKITK